MRDLFTDPLPRPLIALTVLVAAAAIYVGVKDYFEQRQQPTPPATAETAAIGHLKPKARLKKISSAKSRRTGASSAETDGAARGRAPADKPERRS